jgi:transposase
MLAYSIDLRQRVLAAVDANEGTQEEIARRFRVSARWMRKLITRRAATGSIAPKPNGGGRKLLIQGEAAEALKAAIASRPDATLQELREVTGFNGCLMTIWRAIERLGITRKKNPCEPKSNSTQGCSHSGRNGSNGWERSTRTGLSSSMRATPKRP